MKKLVYLLSVFIAFAAGRWSVVPEPPEVRTVFRVDTVKIVQPEVMVVHPRPAIVERLKTVEVSECDSDSARAVYVPMEQKVYSGSGYKAFISGHQPRLDSIELYRPVTVVERMHQSRFSVGLQVGYGITPRGPQPYAGIGISVRIL